LQIPDLLIQVVGNCIKGLFSGKAWTTGSQYESSCSSPCDMYYRFFVQRKLLSYGQCTERLKISVEKLKAGTKNL